MERNKKIGLVIMGGCTVLLAVLLLALGRSAPKEEQTEGNAYPDMAEGTATPVKDSKSEAYLLHHLELQKSFPSYLWHTVLTFSRPLYIGCHQYPYSYYYHYQL